MVEWAAWAPTIVSVATALFVAGGLYGKHKDHSKKLDEHEVKIEHIHVRLNEHEVEIEKNLAWREGYNAATAKHGN